MLGLGQSGGFLGRLLGQWLKTGLSLIKNVLKPLAKSILIPLGLTAPESTTDAAIHKKVFGSGLKTLIILKYKSMVKMNLNLTLFRILGLPMVGGGGCFLATPPSLKSVTHIAQS